MARLAAIRPVNAPASVVIMPPNSKLSPTLRSVELASAKSENSKYAAVESSRGIPTTNVGTLSRLMIIREGSRSPMTRFCIADGMTSDVTLPEADTNSPLTLIAAWVTPTCCSCSRIALALALPALISRWATAALRYACCVLVRSRWFKRLLRVNEYATAARNVDSNSAPMMNIDMIRVRRPNLAGRHLVNSPSAPRRNALRGGSTATASWAMVTTEGDTRGRERSRHAVGWQHPSRPWCANGGR